MLNQFNWDLYILGMRYIYNQEGVFISGRILVLPLVQNIKKATEGEKRKKKSFDKSGT